jgi:hypothetical protein
LTCPVVEEVVAARLRGFLTKKINPGGILSAQTASLRHWYARDHHQSELAILVPNASAEKRTSEQPTGNRTSVTPRDKRIVADTSGPDAAKRGYDDSSKDRAHDEPDRHVGHRPSPRALTHPAARQPEASVLQSLYEGEQERERFSPALPEIARAWIAPLWITRDISNAAGATRKPRRPIT